MNFKSCVAALSLSLLPLASQAGVIYEWRALNNETPWGITLQLEFKQSTVDSGAFSLVVNQDYGFKEKRPDSGLLGLRYSFPGAYDAMTYSRKDGFGDGFGMLEMDVTFEQGGFLSGDIRAYDFQHHFIMGSTGSVFTILDANSDQGMPSAGCEWGSDLACAGARGEISLSEIPEPGSLALMGLGLLAAAGMRRKAAR